MATHEITYKLPTLSNNLEYMRRHLKFSGPPELPIPETVQEFFGFTPNDLEEIDRALLVPDFFEFSAWQLDDGDIQMRGTYMINGKNPVISTIRLPKPSSYPIPDCTGIRQDLPELFLHFLKAAQITYGL